MPGRDATVEHRAVVAGRARLKGFWTQAMLGAARSRRRPRRASAVEMPTPAILPSSRSATISASWSSSARPRGSAASSPGIRRRFTAPSCSTSSVRRLSSTPARRSAGVCAGSQPPCSSRVGADLRDRARGRRGTGAAPRGSARWPRRAVVLRRCRCGSRRRRRPHGAARRSPASWYSRRPITPGPGAASLEARAQPAGGDSNVVVAMVSTVPAVGAGVSARRSRSPLRHDVSLAPRRSAARRPALRLPRGRPRHAARRACSRRRPCRGTRD